MRNDAGEREKTWQKAMARAGVSTVPADVREDCENSIVSVDEGDYAAQVNFYCRMFGRILDECGRRKAGEPRKRRSARRPQGNDWADRADAQFVLRRQLEAVTFVLYRVHELDHIPWRTIVPEWNAGHTSERPLTRRAFSQLFRRGHARDEVVCEALLERQLRDRFSVLVAWIALVEYQRSGPPAEEQAAAARDILARSRREVAGMPLEELASLEATGVARSLCPFLYDEAA